MRVLIVDDDEIALDLLSHTLEEEGYRVETATSGEEACDRLLVGDIRCVITDWEMPGLSGLDVCRFIRSQTAEGYVYVIMLTSHARPDDVVEGLSAGADDFVRKPFDPRELVCRVRVAERILALETRDVTIFALAKLAESRDTDTGEHLERVRRFSKCLAEQLATDSEYAADVDDRFVQLIYQTSPLHDIGKVGIPDCVLLKPGRLSDDEFAIRRRTRRSGRRRCGRPSIDIRMRTSCRWPTTLPRPTTNAGTGGAIRKGCPERGFRWRGGSSPWRTSTMR